MTHRGQIVEKVVRRSGYSLSKIANKLEISRNTLYNRFHDAEVSWDFIRRLGRAIHYDFTVEFPALKEDPEFIDNNTIARVEGQYIKLLEKYNHLLECMLRWTNQTEATHIRRKIIALMDNHSTE